MTDTRHIEVVLPCDDLDPTLEYFRRTLALRLDMIHPADDPREAVLSGGGLVLRLVKGLDASPGRLQVFSPGEETVREETAPNGTVIRFLPERPPVVGGNPERLLSRLDDDSDWITGRAGMRYRDLVPGRQGGGVVASHIRIPDGGPVPDYVHHHRVSFQFIFCKAGWVRVVYQDQGEPFVLRAGDAVLQPPGIRHRVLESSPGLEVIEVGGPADHETWVDHDLELPNGPARPGRVYGGQQFVRFRGDRAEWRPSEWVGFEVADTGLQTASRGAVSVRVLRTTTDDPRSGERAGAAPERRESVLWVALDGQARIAVEDGPRWDLGPGDAACLLPGDRHQLTGGARGGRLLEVRFSLTAPSD